MNINELKTLFRYCPDTGHIYWIAKGKGKIKKKPAGTLLKSGYIGIWITDKRHQAHRLAWALHHGKFSKDQIDHKNGIKTDNRICNLREATNSQNGKNLPSLTKANKSGCRGVCFDKKNNKWRSYIKVDHKALSLGRFDSFEDAVIARKQAEQKYFAEWIRE
jgi:hypothetical protein